VQKKVADSVFTDKNGQDEVTRILEAMVGFVSFLAAHTICDRANQWAKITHLNRIVMPDPGDDDDSDEDEDQDDDEED
jgi:hypothetical protein